MRLLHFVLIIFSFQLTSCQYFGEGKVKSTAEVIALEKLKKVLKVEVNNTVTNAHPRANDYVSFVLQKTKVKIDSITPINKEQYHLKLHVVTINPQAREMLLEIVGKLQGKKANAFNFGDALSLIRSQKSDLKLFVDQNFSLDLKLKGINWVEVE